MRHLRNIFNLGIKELRSLLGDKAMLTLIVFSLRCRCIRQRPLRQDR